MINKLPDPFSKSDENRVASRAEWEELRQEIIAPLLSTQWGTVPGAPENVKTTIGQ